MPEPTERASSPEWAMAVHTVNSACSLSHDPAAAAEALVRVALMALMFYRGPVSAAELAYRQADELVDAGRIVS